MPRHSQRHRTRNLPYKYRDEGLEFAIESYSIDGGKPMDIDLAPSEATIDISPDSPSGFRADRDSWDWATLYGSVTVPESVIEDTFPPEERNEPPARLNVAVRCHDTIYREGVVVTEPPTSPGEYDISLRLNWDNFRGVVELRPYLIRTRGGSETGPHAASRNVKVASGTRYEVVVDHWDDDDPPAIDGEEASFSQTQYLPDDDEMYYLDFRNEGRPKLWINADHPRIADVLRSEGSVGAEPRMRDVILDQISYAVWSQLFFRAATAIDRDGEVEHEWQETVLEAFAPDLYDVEDFDDAKRLLRGDIREPEGMGQLVTRIDTELQKFINPRAQLINLMEEGLQI